MKYSCWFSFNQIPVVLLAWIFPKRSLLVRLFKQISQRKALRASLGGSFSWQSAYISKSQNFANHLWMYPTYALLFQWPEKREVSINVPSDAAQSVPSVLYSSSPQKLQFEFEKNLKIMLTICIPQKHFSCLSTFSWLSRGSRRKFPSPTSNLFAESSDIFRYLVLPTQSNLWTARCLLSSFTSRSNDTGRRLELQQEWEKKGHKALFSSTK